MLKKRLCAMLSVGLTLSTLQCGATTHIYVRTQDGVWLASDSLWIHNDGQRISRRHVCKVVASPGRLIFHAGSFTDLTLLMSQEQHLPFENIDVTKVKLNQLLYKNHMDLSDGPPLDANTFTVNTTVIQVVNGKFFARMVGQNDRHETIFRFVGDAFEIGIPHGYGEAVERVNSAVISNPAIKEKFASDPKAELLKLLQEEAIVNNQAVQPPFTFLLLKNDGTISDFSDTKLCQVLPI